MAKHILIQGKPPKEKKMKEHPVLPNPASEMPLQHGEIPEKMKIYKEADTGKISTEQSIIDRVFKGLPITLKKQEEKED